MPPATLANAQTIHAAVIAQYFLDGVIPHEGHFAFALSFEQVILQDFLRAQLVATMNERHVRGDVREVERLLDSRVPAADHSDFLVLEEESIAGRASRHAPTAEILLGRQAEVLGCCAGRDDQCIRRVVCLDHLPSRNGRCDRSTLLMCSLSTSVLKRSACLRMRSISAGPVSPCGSPGQLSTSTVVMS